LISVGFSSFFQCLRWGKILLRDYQFTWHSPFVLCVPPPPQTLLLFPLHSLGLSPSRWHYLLFDSSSSSPSWLFFIFVFFVFYLTQDLNLLPAVRERKRERERNFRLLVYDVNKGREIIMAVRRNTIIYLARRDFGFTYSSSLHP
jgi:hypothetical protein